MFARKYRLGVKQETNDQGTYFVLMVDLVGLAAEDEFSLAENLWKEFHVRRKDIQVHEERPDDAEGGEKPPF